MPDLEALRLQLNDLRETARTVREELLGSARESSDPVVREIAEEMLSEHMTARDIVTNSFYGEFLRQKAEEVEDAQDPEDKNDPQTDAGEGADKPSPEESASVDVRGLFS
jgi:hypothetical protein